MASSSSLIGGGIRHSLNRQDRSLLSDHHPCSYSSCSVTIPRHHHHQRARGRIVNSASVPVTAETAIKTSRREWNESETRLAVEAHEKKVDAWMLMSAKEIVLSLKDAPLLVHVYGGDERMTMETRKRAERGNWAELTTGSTAPLPEGLIFVKELTDEDDGVNYPVRKNSATKIWGMVVQGRGCGPVCYLLKTCKVEVGSGVGPGAAGIHFLLLRVKDFREKASSQFKNCWLVQSTGPPPYSGICFG